MSQPDLPHRRSIRLPGYDYTNQGAYFVTMCVQHREMLLGDILDGEAVLSEAGQSVDTTWNTLPDRFPTMDIDAYVIMANHVHGIFLLGAREIEPTNRAPDPSLAAVVGAFKSISGIACNRVSDRQGQPFWQRNYYERIIRNDHELDRIRQYIFNNPANWTIDSENPFRVAEADHKQQQ